MKVLKENLLLVLASILLVVFVIFIAFFMFFSPGTKTASSPNQNQNQNLSQNRDLATSQPLKYDLKSQKKLLQYISTKALGQSDIDSKNRILQSLGGKSGIVYSSPNVEVDYIKLADLFEANIKNGNFYGAKNEVVVWLRKQGLSQTGICNLPLMFSVSWDVSEKKPGALFSPLPPGC
ncbi:MAG: hypothetical protein M1450_05355 [Patescibacteria group bacterium]|nr:hypothetical protein [Patescibacteria group bacterium]